MRHSDHRAAAVLAGQQAGLAVLGLDLPAAVAIRLSAETGQDFCRQPPGRIDLCVRSVHATTTVAADAVINSQTLITDWMIACRADGRARADRRHLWPATPPS